MRHGTFSFIPFSLCTVPVFVVLLILTFYSFPVTKLPNPLGPPEVFWLKSSLWPLTLMTSNSSNERSLKPSVSLFVYYGPLQSSNFFFRSDILFVLTNLSSVTSSSLKFLHIFHSLYWLLLRSPQISPYSNFCDRLISTLCHLPFLESSLQKIKEPFLQVSSFLCLQRNP